MHVAEASVQSGHHGPGCSCCQARFVALWPARGGIEGSLRRRGADRETAADAVAEAYAIAWERLDRLPHDPAQARAWLRTTAGWVLMNLWRRMARQVDVAERLAPRHAGDDSPRHHSVGHRTEVVDAFRSLTSRDRWILWLQASRGLSTAQLARELGCSSSAALVRLHRARRRFESALEPGA